MSRLILPSYAESHQRTTRILRLSISILLNAALLALGLFFTLRETDAGTRYPNRPIKLIVPFGAGGGTDTFARIMKKAIDDEGLLSQPVAIINVGGAGATIGSRRVKNARPDGYTMLVLHDAIFTAQFSGTVEYGPDEFEPIAGTGEIGLVIAVLEDSPYRTLDDLMQAARQRPDEVNFGANLGAMTHYGGLQLEDGWPGAKFRFSQVGGGADRYADLEGRHIEVTGFSIEEFTRFRHGEFGDLRGLAYFGEKPHPAAPDVPPAKGADGRSIVNRNIFYWWFPQETPADRVELMADVFERAMQTKYVQAKLKEIQCEPVFLRGAALERHLNESSARYAAITPPAPVELPNFPAIIFVVLVALAALVVVQSWRNNRRVTVDNQREDSEGAVSPTPQSPSTHDSKPASRHGLAIVCAVITGLYVLAMNVAEIDFRIATVAYVLTIGGSLLQFNPRRLPWMLAVAQSMAFGLYFIMTRLFEIDLP